MAASLVTIVLPFFALIGCGYLAGRARVVRDAGLAGINAFTIYFALPAFVFSRITAAPAPQVSSLGYVAAYGIATLLVFGLGLLAARALFAAPGDEAALQGLAAAFSNTGYLGLPLAVALLGEASAVPAVLAFAFDNTLLLLLAVLAVEAGGGRGLRLAAAGTLLVRNPLLLAIVLGLLVSAAGLPVPDVLASFARLLGNAAGPCGLFALGASLAARRLSGDLRPIGVSVALKLVAHPLLVVAAMLLAGVDGLWLRAAVLSAALPVGASVFVLAAQYHVQVARTSATVLVSTVLALGSLPLAVVLLGALPLP